MGAFESVESHSRSALIEFRVGVASGFWCWKRKVAGSSVLKAQRCMTQQVCNTEGKTFSFDGGWGGEEDHFSSGCTADYERNQGFLVGETHRHASTLSVAPKKRHGV